MAGSDSIRKNIFRGRTRGRGTVSLNRGWNIVYGLSLSLSLPPSPPPLPPLSLPPNAMNTKRKRSTIRFFIRSRLKTTPGIHCNACHAYACRVRRLSDRQKLLSMIRNVVGLIAGSQSPLNKKKKERKREDNEAIR